MSSWYYFLIAFFAAIVILIIISVRKRGKIENNEDDEEQSKVKVENVDINDENQEFRNEDIKTDTDDYENEKQRVSDIVGRNEKPTNKKNVVGIVSIILLIVSLIAVAILVGNNNNLKKKLVESNEKLNIANEELSDIKSSLKLSGLVLANTHQELSEISEVDNYVVTRGTIYYMYETMDDLGNTVVEGLFIGDDPEEDAEAIIIGLGTTKDFLGTEYKTLEDYKDTLQGKYITVICWKAKEIFPAVIIVDGVVYDRYLNRLWG